LIFSNYQILESLGTGQYGQVYRGRCLKTQTIVAIKELSLKNTSTARFIRELRALSRNQHPNLVNLIGIEYCSKGRYLIMDYCDRGTLGDLMADAESIPLGLKINLVLDILSGLRYLHQLGICHCDLKPQNILLSQGRDRLYARLGDLGSAINRDLLSNGKGFLEPNALPGSPAYMAPERFYGEFSVATDLYSVGVILYELIVGDRPFLGPIQDLTRGHLSETLQLPADLPFLFRQLIQKALQKLPQHRFQSADDMWRSCQLAGVNSGVTLESSPLLPQ
jgi:eukaryotic-like serine/threonine-protein kinase